MKKSTGEVLGTITISIGVAQFGAARDGRNGGARADACLLWRQANRPQSGDRGTIHGPREPRGLIFFYPHLSATRRRRPADIFARQAASPHGGRIPVPRRTPVAAFLGNAMLPSSNLIAGAAKCGLISSAAM